MTRGAIISSALTLGLSVVAAGIGLGLFLIQQAYFSPIRTQFDIQWVEKERDVFMPDPELGWSTKPNAHGTIQHPAPFEVFTDSRGARVPLPGDQTPATVDVMEIGCSQTFGHAVTGADTYAAQLGTKIDGSVGNFGVSGYSTLQSLLRLRKNANLRPRYVIYGLYQEHLERNVERCVVADGPICWQRPVVTSVAPTDILLPDEDAADAFWQFRQYVRETTSKSDKYRNFFTDLKWTWRALRKSIAEHYSRTTAAATLDFRYRAMRFLIDEMRRTTQQMGAQLIVVYIPQSYFLPEPIPAAPAELKHILSSPDIAFIDMQPIFERMRQEGIELAVPIDHHLSPKAHKAIARQIAPQMGALRKSTDQMAPIAKPGG